MVLPCKHEQSIVDQVAPTINLLSNMDVLYPDILLKHSIQPTDYKGSLVFRSAIESIRGTYIASSTAGREALVGQILVALSQRQWIADYSYSSGSGRYDFTVVLSREPDVFAALEVKGGEGNSINISERPIWAREFGIWCHLDGAVVNQPSHGARAVVNRLVNELVRRHKQVDVLFIKDILCGTRVRPCPKYLDREAEMGAETAPDIFLFPQRIPTLVDPEPPTHTFETLRLLGLVLDLFGIDHAARPAHTWDVKLRVVESHSGRVNAITTVWHQGQLITTSVSRPWSK